MLYAQNGATDAKLRHDEHGNLKHGKLGDLVEIGPPDLGFLARILMRHGSCRRAAGDEEEVEGGRGRRGPVRSGRRRSHGTTGSAGEGAGRREMKAAARTRRLRGGRPRAGGARAAAAAGWAAGARIGLRGPRRRWDGGIHASISDSHGRRRDLVRPGRTCPAGERGRGLGFRPGLEKGVYL